MRQFKKFGLRSLPPQSFDDAKTHTAATVDGDTLRFVDDQYRIVFENDRQIDALLGDFIHFVFWSFRNTDRWNSQIVPDTEPVSSVDPFAIYAYFTAPQNPVNMAFRNTFAAPDQEVVEALTLLFVADHYVGDRIVTYSVHFLIYCLRSTSRFARDAEPSDRLCPRANSATAKRQARSPTCANCTGQTNVKRLVKFTPQK